jgi:hypothetical protein
MTVASFHRNGHAPVIRGFAPPKTASISHWYRAAVANITHAPSWREAGDELNLAQIDEGAIVVHGDDWSLFIARKRFLK